MNVIIMRGIPGSGKSTYIKKNCNPAYICSSDTYHVSGGVYQWKPENVKKAHALCLQKFVDGLCTKQPLIVVDNTNISVWEIAPYYALAEAYGASVEIVSFKYKDTLEAMLCGFRNVHGVPDDTLSRMYFSMVEQTRLFPKHWKTEYILPGSGSKQCQPELSVSE